MEFRMIGDGAGPGRNLAPWLLATWYALGLAVVLLIPALAGLQEPPWRLSGSHLWVALGLGAAYLSSCAALFVVTLINRRITLVTAVAVVGTSLALLYLLVLTLSIGPYSRIVLLSGSFLVAGLVILPALMRPGIKAVSVLVVGLAVCSIGVVAGHFEEEEDKTPVRIVEKRLLASSLYAIDATYYSNFLHGTAPVLGGGLDVLEDAFILGHGDGTLYRFRWDDHDSLVVESLPTRVPVNRDEFIADAGKRVNAESFRVADILVEEEGDQVRLFASHHFWKSHDQCFVVRLSLLSVPAPLVANLAALDTTQWRTVYETQPCLPLLGEGKGVPFEGPELGGRLASMGSDSILMTVGGHGMVGWRVPELAQDTSADYGSVLQITPSTGRREVFTYGHRNPQGLFIDSRGQIWSTEHGPDGGDELNRLLSGSNYGWPHETYGTDYNSITWSRRESNPGDYTGPLFAWVPSIGVSSLLSVRGSAFGEWEGDLLVSSLKNKRLRRLRISEGRVVFDEPLRIGERVRDILEDPAGRVLLWTDADILVRLEPAKNLNRGAVLFLRHCRSCHTTGGGLDRNTVGPDLSGIPGRPVGSLSFYDYSRAMIDFEGEWTVENLHSFLSAPARFIPGTAMSFPGMADSTDRHAIIDFLANETMFRYR